MSSKSAAFPMRPIGSWVRLPATLAGWGVLALMIVAAPASATLTGYGLPAVLVIALLARLFADK